MTDLILTRKLQIISICHLIAPFPDHDDHANDIIYVQHLSKVVQLRSVINIQQLLQYSEIK